MIKAVMFIGTPHRGSASSHIGAVVARILSSFRLRAIPEMLEAVAYDSLELMDMNARFEAISEDIAIVNMFEMVAQPQFGGLLELYVGLKIDICRRSALSA